MLSAYYRQISQEKDIVSDPLKLLLYYCSVTNSLNKKSDYLGSEETHGIGNKPMGVM